MLQRKGPFVAVHGAKRAKTLHQQNKMTHKQQAKMNDSSLMKVESSCKHTTKNPSSNRLVNHFQSCKKKVFCPLSVVWSCVFSLERLFTFCFLFLKHFFAFFRTMESLPPEILRLILGGTNLSIVRLVSQRMNQLGSVLLLETRTKSLHALVGRLMVVVSEKTNKLLDREDQRLELVLKTSEELAQLEKEISALEVRVREKQSSVDVLLGTALPPAQRQQLLRLCDLHSEFVCFAALRERAVRLGKVLLQEGGQAPFDWDRAQAPPPRRGLMEPRRDPVLPHGFDPYGEPDPDHLHWRGGDDDEIPDYPGLYGPPGRNDP